MFSLLKFSWVWKRFFTIQSRKAILRTSTFPASGCDGYIPVQCLLDMARRRSRRHIDIHRNSSVPCSSRISHVDCGVTQWYFLESSKIIICKVSLKSYAKTLAILSQESAFQEPQNKGLRQAFLFDLFLASKPSGFAETLSFLLELLSFFPLSFEGMFEDFKNSIFLL